MDSIRFLIFGVVAAFFLTAAGLAGAAQDLLAPNVPSLTTVPDSALLPPPADEGVPDKPSPTGSLDLTTPNQPSSASTIAPADIPETVMTEMKQIEDNCNGNYFYSSFHDCKCISVKFLDARLRSDPDVPKERVFNEIAAQCPDEAGIAGYIYKSCASYMNTVRKDYVSFCGCTANDVARAYARTPVSNLRYIETLRRNAFLNCGIADNPDYASPYPR